MLSAGKRYRGWQILLPSYLMLFVPLGILFPVLHDGFVVQNESLISGGVRACTHVRARVCRMREEASCAIWRAAPHTTGPQGWCERMSQARNSVS